LEKIKKATKNCIKALDFTGLKCYIFKHQKQTDSERIMAAMKNMKVFGKEYFMYPCARFMSAYCRCKN